MMSREIKTIFFVFSNMSGKLIIYKICLFILNLSFANANQTFKCTSTNDCYTETEVCVKGQCIPSCVDDKSCEEGQYCHIDHLYCHNPCKSNIDCQFGYQCYYSKCYKPCQSDRYCGNNQYCSK